MENIQLKEKLLKVYELVKRGGTEGEQAAAKKALDKLIEKYNLQGIDLDNLEKSIYKFKYRTKLDEWLLIRIVKVFTDNQARETAVKNTWRTKEIHLNLTYLDYITVSTSYEYFKRHMLVQWKLVCAADIKRKRSNKARSKRREELQGLFFSRYIVLSNLYLPGEVRTVDLSGASKKELQDQRLVRDVEGGKYNRQVTNGLLLD